jgi:Uma2 family endonuclease
MAAFQRASPRSPMSTPTRVDSNIWTLAEYALLQESDAWRSELVQGRLVREPRPGATHGFVQARLARRLSEFTESRGIGTVLTDVGIVLAQHPPTVRGPDVLFISRERMPQPLPRGFLEIPPDLVVEITSPSNTASEVQRKLLEYLAAGVRVVWVVDPESRTATSYRAGGDARVLTEDESLDGGDVIPGLSLPLLDLWPS